MTRTIAYDDLVDPLGRCVAALGVFDGVHVGHQRLVRDAVALASLESASSAVVTFDRDPESVLQPHSPCRQLLSLDDKVACLEALSPDLIVVIPFDHELAALSPDAFVSDVLLKSMQLAAVVVGRDFRFGRYASGDITTLRDLGSRYDFEVVAHELLHVGGEPVTSTRVRAAIADGDVTDAARLLGRPHRVHGRVVRGRGAGRRIGVPTANLRVDSRMALPGDGVYAGNVILDGRTYPAGISVGRPPSFPEAIDLLEAHLVGYEGPDLYGHQLVVEFVERIRDQHAFADTDSLAEAIRADLDRVRRVAGDGPSS